MRVAVALPTLPPGAPHRERLDAALVALTAAGVEIEAFAERPRDRDGDDPFPVFHYLRLRERHAGQPFDTGLALLGRDMRAWEPPYLQMRSFPGAVWLLDPVVHHLLIGGVTVWGRWDEYRDTLEAEFGEETGAIMAHTVAGGWGVSSLYRTRDPLLRIVARQPAVGGATGAIVSDLKAAGAESTLVPLPRPVGITGERKNRRQILLLRPNYAWMAPALRGVGDAIRAHPDVRVSICAPPIVRSAGARFPDGYEWLGERVDWIDSGDWTGLTACVDESTWIVHLLDDPTVGERALMHQAMASGRVLITLRTRASESYGEASVVRIEAGRGQGRALAETLRVLLEDQSLTHEIGMQAKREMASTPCEREVAARLRGMLERAAECGFQPNDLTAGLGRTLLRSLEAKALPSSSDVASSKLFRARWLRVGPPVVRRAIEARLPSPGGAE